MELIDRITGLENEMNTVKGEVKKVLIDLREAMNTAENPLNHIEQLQHLGAGSVDEERIKNLEDAIGKLKNLSNGNGIDEGRIKNLEDAIEELKAMSNGNGIDEGRIKNLEDTIEELKAIGIGNGVDEEMLKKLEDNIQELNELGGVEVERLKNLEAAVERLEETRTQSERPLLHNLAASESELNRFGAELGAGVRSVTGSEIIDTLTLAQLIQWANSALNLIGMERLNHVVDLYELTGRLSGEMKETILKITELPVADLNPEKERVETKYCIIALFELDRILTGENQELFTLLKELC